MLAASRTSLSGKWAAERISQSQLLRKSQGGTGILPVIEYALRNGPNNQGDHHSCCGLPQRAASTGGAGPAISDRSTSSAWEIRSRPRLFELGGLPYPADNGSTPGLGAKTVFPGTRQSAPRHARPRLSWRLSKFDKETVTFRSLTPPPESPGDTVRQGRLPVVSTRPRCSSALISTWQSTNSLRLPAKYNVVPILLWAPAPCVADPFYSAPALQAIHQAKLEHPALQMPLQAHNREDRFPGRISSAFRPTFKGASPSTISKRVGRALKAVFNGTDVQDMIVTKERVEAMDGTPAAAITVYEARQESTCGKNKKMTSTDVL